MINHILVLFKSPYHQEPEIVVEKQHHENVIDLEYSESTKCWEAV